MLILVKNWNINGFLLFFYFFFVIYFWRHYRFSLNTYITSLSRRRPMLKTFRHFFFFSYYYYILYIILHSYEILEFLFYVDYIFWTTKKKPKNLSQYYIIFYRFGHITISNIPVNAFFTHRCPKFRLWHYFFISTHRTLQSSSTPNDLLNA